MPLYEYNCPDCGDFEVLQKVSDPFLTHHQCGKAVTRKVSRASFQLKGGGWYADLYSSKKPDKGSDSSKPAEKAA